MFYTSPHKNLPQDNMTQNRMNNIIILNTYKEELDKPDMTQIANEFWRECDERMNVFAKFSKKDYPTMHTKRTSVATQRPSVWLFIRLFLPQTQAIVNVVLLLRKSLSFYCLLKPILMSSYKKRKKTIMKI